MINKNKMIIGIVFVLLLGSLGIAQIISNRSDTTLRISSEDSTTIKNRYGLNNLNLQINALPCDTNFCYFQVKKDNFINENIRVAKLNRTGTEFEGEIDKKVNERLAEIAHATRERQATTNPARSGGAVESR